VRGSRDRLLVATPLRWGTGTLLLALAVVLAREAYGGIAHTRHSLFSSLALFAVASVVVGLVVFAILRAEEARLGSELRTARTGSPVLRAMAARRRESAPLVLRIFATKLGVAALLLADGDAAAAKRQLRSASPLGEGGRLDELRAIVRADLDRAAAPPAATLQRCVERLRSSGRTGNREADLYRTHVLVKAVLQQGATDTALELAAELAVSADADERLYATWLRAWFDLEAKAPDVCFPPVTEGELRLASLVARAHGAERLVAELEGRLATIARPAREE
jgi:hypothetical protein